MLVLMGSGETSPTMVELHKRLRRRTRDLGPLAVVDTPYGFQENADELTARIQRYFRDNVGTDTQVGTLRTSEVPAAELAAFARVLDGAGHVFSGPGSPTYALRHWHGVGLAPLLLAVLRRGGVVNLASAASVTAGRWSLPVYEIYKAGQPATWAPGLDLLSELGVPCAVVPHFDNKEGGTHDTSCCYVGRRRLDALRQAAAVPLVVGIDEHTSLSVDPVTLKAEVHGQGGVTLLTTDEEIRHVAGTRFLLAEARAAPAPPLVESTRADSPVGDLDVGLARLQTALLQRNAGALVDAVHRLLHMREPTGGLQVAQAATRLEEGLAGGWAQCDDRGSVHEDHVLVEGLLRVRDVARERAAWDVADLVRTVLADAGLTVRDTPDGPAVTRS